MNTLDFIVESDEEILWYGKVSQEAINWVRSRKRKYLIILIFQFFSGAFLFLFFTWLFIFLSLELDILAVIPEENRPNAFFVILVIIWVGTLIFSSFITGKPLWFFLGKYRYYFLALNGYIAKEYYITEKKEFERVLETNKNEDCYHKLELSNIEKIIIRPIKKWNNTIAHIDFYSNFIINNPEEYSFHVKIGDKIIHPINGDGNQYKKYFEVKPENRIWIPHEGICHRFFYINLNKDLEIILKNLFPNKVEFDYTYIKQPSSGKFLNENLPQ